MLRPYVIIDVSVVFVMCSASAFGKRVCVMPGCDASRSADHDVESVLCLDDPVFGGVCSGVLCSGEDIL